VRSSDAGGDDTAAVEPPLWKCYWTKMQLMLLLSGLFMLIGSLLHLCCPLLLIFILDYVENKADVGKTGGNATLPRVRLATMINSVTLLTITTVTIHYCIIISPQAC